MNQEKTYDARLMVPESYRAECRRLGISYGKMLMHLWSNYGNADILDDQGERELIQKAIDRMKLSAGEFTRRAKLYYASIATGEKILDKSLSKNTLDANERLAKVVEAMMSHNEKAKNWWEKMYIAPNTIQKYVVAHKKELGFMSLNHRVLSRLDELYGDLLQKHFEQHELDKDHNIKASRYMRVNKIYK